MSRTSILVPLTVIALGLLCPARSQAQSPLPLDIEQVSERVLVMSPKTGNARVVALNSQQGLVMINSGFSPSFARQLRGEAERAFGHRDWKAVIQTNAGFLNNGGAGAFPEALLLAHEGRREYLLSSGETNSRALAGQKEEFEERVTRSEGMLDTLQGNPVRRQGLEEWVELCRRIADDLSLPYEIPLPELTFSDRLTLDLGDLTLECFWFGETAEGADVLVRVPEENLVWMGDIFHAAHVLPYGRYGDRVPDVDRWLEVLDIMLSGEPETMKVYRANGEDPWSWQKIHDRRTLIADVRDAVRAAQERGESRAVFMERIADAGTMFRYVREWENTELNLIGFDVGHLAAGLWLER
jgi:hypothetical protein